MPKNIDKPIHFVPDGKNFVSLEKAIKTFGITEIRKQKELEKELEKGNHVYCFVITAEENDVKSVELFWYKHRENAMDDYYIHQEEI